MFYLLVQILPIRGRMETDVAFFYVFEKVWDFYDGKCVRLGGVIELARGLIRLGIILIIFWFTGLIIFREGFFEWTAEVEGTLERIDFLFSYY
jgi:hypothetical protein